MSPRNLLLTCIVLLGVIPALRAQGIPKQEKLAKQFFQKILDGKFKAAYNILDARLHEKVDLDEFEKLCASFLDIASKSSREFTYVSGMRKEYMGQLRIAYSFRFKSTIEPEDSDFYAVFDGEEGEHIIEFKWRKEPPRMQVPGESVKTIAAPETSLQTRETWEIAGKETTVLEVTVVHFPGGEDMLVVKAEHPIGDGKDTKALEAAAVPIAQAAYHRGFLSKAEAISMENGTKLVSEIGVALIEPGIAQGYRVRVKESDYRK